MWQRIGLVVLVLLLLFILNAFLNPIPKREKAAGKYPSYGVSYSFEQANWLGLDSREAFANLITNYNFDWVRVPFFWNQMVDDYGNLQIGELKFAIEEADKKGVKVIIALGAKIPYYPEFHFPEYIASKLKPGQIIDVNDEISQQILDINKKLVEQLAVYENISYWQIENEPFTPNENGWTLSEDLIQEEIEVVRRVDTLKRPIIVSHVGPVVFDLRWKKLLNILAPGDVLGVNAYFKTQAPHLFNINFFGKQIAIAWPRGFSWPVQSWGFFSPNFAGIKNEAAKSGVDVWVMEMQAEPYIRNLEEARKREFSFSVDDIKKANNYITSENIETIGLWGASFWQYRESIGDLSWANTVREVIR